MKRLAMSLFTVLFVAACTAPTEPVGTAPDVKRALGGPANVECNPDIEICEPCDPFSGICEPPPCDPTDASVDCPDFTTAGPFTFVRATGQPAAQSITFDGSPAGGGDLSAIMHIVAIGTYGFRGTVSLNGVAVATRDVLHGLGPMVMDVPVTVIEGTNTVTVELRGKPGTGVNITITGTTP